MESFVTWYADGSGNGFEGGKCGVRKRLLRKTLFGISIKKRCAID